MIKDPEEVARLAARREADNWRFRAFVKMSPRLTPARVDGLAERFGSEATAQIDCRECAACCRDNCIPVTDEEVARLAEGLGTTAEQIRRRYVLVQDEDGEPAIDATPCPLLDGTLCSAYEHRPDACRGYPYIGGSVAPRMAGIIERAGTCPIVFDMLERLKDALGFARYC